MKITLNWLKDHLETNASLSDITEKLTHLGLEVEGVDNPAERYKGFVIAKVITRDKHPNADRLSLCQVDAGTGSLFQVVCGAPNVRAGMMTVFAPIGTTIPLGGAVLKPTKIREVDSQGMLCSARELLMGEDSDGILDLETQADPGTPLADALHLDDPVIEISLTPNRADCFGVRGIARDLAASGLGSLKPLRYSPIPGSFEASLQVLVKDSQGCTSFQGRGIRGVKNGPSPEWIQRRLTAVGLRPISALVDVTNYIMMDLGRPLHVFDAGKIKGNLQVRAAKSGETLSALNDKEYTLSEGMITVADEDQVLALAGVIGGTSSACSADTTDVFIESAHFDPVRTAHTGRELQLLSDARTRFERGVDPLSVPTGIDAATHFILDWCGGEASHRLEAQFDTPPAPVVLAEIQLTQDKLTRLTGMSISLTQAREWLERLEFTVLSASEEALTVRAPSHRMDMEGPADLVEEILRLIGYDQIPLAPLPRDAYPLTPPSVAQIARAVLSSRGLHEAITWSFMKEDLAIHFGDITDSMRIDNPMTSFMAVLRPSILPNLLEAAVGNLSRGVSEIALFEVGPQFDQGIQSRVATGLLAGHSCRHWAVPARVFDLYDAKAHALALLQTLGVGESSLQCVPEGPDFYHPGRRGRLKQGNRILAQFGEIHPAILQAFNQDQRVVGFEVYLDKIPSPKQKRVAPELSPYQPVTRDFAFVVEETLPAEDVVKAIAKADRELIQSVQIFDVYVGDKLPSGKKSLAIQVRLQPKAATLTDAEITTLSDQIIKNVAQSTGGSLRQS